MGADKNSFGGLGKTRAGPLNAKSHAEKDALFGISII